jgi:hypothetical protein
MPYRVLKKINGNYYWYEQKTVRQGKTVKTVVSKCLGRAGYFAAYSKQINKIDKFRQSTKNDLDIRIDTARLYISSKSLQKDWRKVNEWFTSRGFKEPLPHITIRHGFKTEIRRTKKGYEVIAPRAKGYREQVRFAYRKALASALLETIAAEKPAVHESLERAFNPSYRATQDALLRYYASNKSKLKYARMLALKWFAQANKPHHSMKPQTLGLAEWGKRESWQYEFVGLTAEVIGKGIKPLYEETNKAYFGARKAEEEAVRMPAIWFLTKRKRLAKAIARKDLQAERMRKLEVLQRFLTLH